jgi:hypothetical protein
MSGESIAGVGVEAGIGAMMLLGTAAGASCAFVVGHGLSALGSHLERREAERDAERAVMAEWEHALHSVALRNARIGALLDASGSAGRVTVPAPLVLGQQTLADLDDWCATTDALLNDAEREVVEHSAQAIVLRAADLAGLAELRTGFDDPGDEPSAAAAKRAPALGDTVRDDITRVAGRLSADATAQEREDVAKAAERVLTARSRIDARNRLADMRARVDQANREAAGRLAQAAEAAQLLQPLAHADASAQPLRADLLKVVTGDAPLTEGLRERARTAAADVQRASDRRYVRNSVTEALAELGYVVDEGFQTAVVKDGVLQVTRNEWNAHGVRMALDEEKQELRTIVVRTQADGGWDAARVDTERESQWCGIQEQLKAKLAARNVRYELLAVTAPGARPVPVVRGAPALTHTTHTTQPAAEAPRTGQA